MVNAIHDSQMAEEEGMKGGVTAGASQSRNIEVDNSIVEDDSDSLPTA